MASVSIHRQARGRTVRWRVQYRLGGRESRVMHGGVFATRRLAEKRRDWIAGELANLRVPDLRLVDRARSAITLRAVAEEWRTSRVDVGSGTAATHRVNLNRILPTLGDRAIDDIDAGDIAGLVAEMHDAGLARESIRKTVATLAMVFDHAERVPNPARDKRVRLPQSDRAEVNPPTAAHVVAVHGLLPATYRLPVLVLDATGMRVSELESLTWGDVDEPEQRWRVSAASAKTKRARWVPVPPTIFAAVMALVPRDDRDFTAQVFAGFGADRFRTAITRACRATGVPTFSPHDLRHRRASLWHLSGVPAAQAAAWLGHSAQEHLRTYAHVVMDRSEVAYDDLMAAWTDTDDAIAADYARACTNGDTPVTHTAGVAA